MFHHKHTAAPLIVGLVEICPKTLKIWISTRPYFDRTNLSTTTTTGWTSTTAAAPEGPTLTTWTLSIGQAAAGEGQHHQLQGAHTYEQEWGV